LDIWGREQPTANVLISLDEGLLERLDLEAAERRMSRSALIAELAARGLGEPVGPRALADAREATRRLKALLQPSASGDSTAWIRQERDSR